MSRCAAASLLRSPQGRLVSPSGAVSEGVVPPCLSQPANAWVPTLFGRTCARTPLVSRARGRVIRIWVFSGVRIAPGRSAGTNAGQDRLSPSETVGRTPTAASDHAQVATDLSTLCLRQP